MSGVFEPLQHFKPKFRVYPEPAPSSRTTRSSFHGTRFNAQLLLEPLINSCCPSLFLPFLLSPPPPSLAPPPPPPPPSFAALVQIPLLLRGRGGVVGGEGVGERTAVSLSTALLSPPSATLVSSVCGCARARTLVCHSVGLSGSSDAG